MNNRVQIPLLSLMDMCKELADITGSEIIDHEGRYITYTGPSMFYGKNFILKADESEIDPIIKEIRENMTKGRPAGIGFTTETMPDNISEVLKKYGFAPFITQTGMIFDLEHGFDETVCKDIELVGDDRIMEWCVTNGNGFPKPREDDSYVSIIKSSRLITYGYMQDGKIASTGMLLIHPEISGIHEIATLPEFRGRGQATAIILRMLADLKSRGITSVSLQASDAGKNYVYEPLGFETVSSIPSWIPAG